MEEVTASISSLKVFVQSCDKVIADIAKLVAKVRSSLSSRANLSHLKEMRLDREEVETLRAPKTSRGDRGKRGAVKLDKMMEEVEEVRKPKPVRSHSQSKLGKRRPDGRIRLSGQLSSRVPTLELPETRLEESGSDNEMRRDGSEKDESENNEDRSEGDDFDSVELDVLSMMAKDVDEDMIYSPRMRDLMLNRGRSSDTLKRSKLEARGNDK